MRNPPRFLLLHGSVTGKAESIGELIAKEADKRGLHADVRCMSQVGKGVDLLSESVVVFVSSTTGDGEQPEKAIPLWRSLRKKTLPADHLAHLCYAQLGLGDSNYSQFCNGPKTLNRRLRELGARHLVDPAWADDGVGLELVVEPWLDSLWPALEKFFELPSSSQLGPSRVSVSKKSSPAESMESATPNMDVGNLIKLLGGLSVKPGDAPGLATVADRLPENITIAEAPANFLKLRFLKESDNAEKEPNPPAKFSLATTEVFRVKIAGAKNLTDGQGVKRCVLLTLNLKDSTIRCSPGDSIGFVCSNEPAEVEALISRLGLNSVADCLYELSVDEKSENKRAKLPDFIPKKSTLREILLNVIDIRGVPKKPLLRALAEHTADADEQRNLLALCSREAAGMYLSEVRAASLGLLDLLLTFSSCKPPIECVLEHASRLQPRPFSAASEQTEDGLVDIVFNVVDLEQANGRRFPRRGLCTGWLEDCAKQVQLGKEVRIPVFGRSSKGFQHPSDVSANLIMIGPGTGVAPFRGFLQLRERMTKEMEKKDAGRAWLFFGCRHKGKDHIFQTDLEDFAGKGVLDNLFVAYSRDDLESPERYVQHMIESNSKEFVDLLLDAERPTVLFVCGDARNMAKDVNDTIIRCLEKERNLSSQEAKMQVADMVMNKKYLQDLWT